MDGAGENIFLLAGAPCPCLLFNPLQLILLSGHAMFLELSYEKLCVLSQVITSTFYLNLWLKNCWY